MDLGHLFSEVPEGRFLAVEGFRDLMWKIDRDLSLGEIEYLMNEIDSDGNGRVDMDEFRRALQVATAPKAAVTRMSTAVASILLKLNAIVQKYKVDLYHLFLKYSKNDVLDLG